MKLVTLSTVTLMLLGTLTLADTSVTTETMVAVTAEQTQT